MGTLERKSVLITGGAGALGQATAERFLAEGASVSITYLSEHELKRLSETFKENVFTVRADVTKDGDVAALFHQVIDRFGQVDMLVNLVGGFLPRTMLLDVSSKDWDPMINLNLRSVFLCAREFLHKLPKTDYGRIVSIAAMPALKPTAGRGPYAVSKAGVITLTQVLGEELKGTGVTANAIAPSILKTKANMDSMPQEDFSGWVRLEEIVETIVFLCSENGRSINGVCIPMFGGLS